MVGSTDAEDRAVQNGARRWVAVVALALLVASGVAALGVRHYEEVSRASLLARFDQKVVQAAGFVGVYLDDLGDRSRLIASRQLGGTTVGDTDVAGTTGDLGVPLAIVLDDSGRLLAADPPRDELLGRDLTGSYIHLAEAVTGRRAVSDVVLAAGLDDPIVALAVPYETSAGRRVFSLGFRPGETPLGSYLADLVPVGDVQTYLLDSQANVLFASEGTPSAGLTGTVPGLQAAVSAGTSAVGSYTAGGEERHYAVHPVDGTGWTLLSTVPSASILGPLAPSLWVGRAGLVLLVLAVVAALWLLWRVAERDRRLLVANRKLDEALHLRGMFIDVASHELRTPMTVIHGFIATLAERWSDLSDERRLTLIHTVRRHSDRLVGLIEDVLEMSRLQEGRAAVAPGIEIPAATIVSEAVASSFLTEADVKMDCAPRLTILADPVAAQRILRNLLDNAARYGRPPVDISVHRDGEVVRFAVTDAGPGVPEHFVRHMFEPFAQGEAVENHGQGSGLGLAIAHGLAAEMGGQLTYRALPVTTFELTLPAGGPEADNEDGREVDLNDSVLDVELVAGVLAR